MKGENTFNGLSSQVISNIWIPNQTAKVRMETTEFVTQVIYKYATQYHCSKDPLLIWFHRSVSQREISLLVTTFSFSEGAGS